MSSNFRMIRLKLPLTTHPQESSNNVNPSSKKIMIPKTTGWQTSGYEWGSIDNATWSGFILYQLYFTFLIAVDAILTAKRTLIWGVVFLSLTSNILSAITGFLLQDCVIFNPSYATQPATCDPQLHAYYFFECCCFVLGFWLLFYRKYKVVPETVCGCGVMDMAVFGVCAVLNVVANLPCLYRDSVTCFQMDVYQAVAVGISFLYFDVWFMVRVIRNSFRKGGKWELVSLTMLTGSLTVVYLTGSVCYKVWGGNFYTNILWNMGYCLFPLYCIETIVNSKFMRLFNQTKSLTDPTNPSNNPCPPAGVTTSMGKSANSLNGIGPRKMSGTPSSNA
ncbi:hypothetical protein BCR33DRAFT_447289 [Rhizoclosmatium globosum]|uniref:Uncharacterized protein n=1 Tax=Rhizoclosmatium globosum TaxID=329046 RepID=A0A1Y2BSH2_9FUNG|nr:hypothetical protein BCR33DRAFT_447289 [Rhizoclosmatium globosum]|eukprot:ORY37587.1 hypothetical protein BCR33DRAFT_447289 [Rhizoclosmatium globosum]